MRGWGAIGLVALACTAEPSTTGTEPVGCAALPDFSPCEGTTGADAKCLAGTCVALEPCGAGGCSVRPEFPPPDTLLTDCHDDLGVIPCPGTPVLVASIEP